MQLKVKDVDLSSGGPLIAILNERDATKLDLHTLDRIKISRFGRSVVTVIDISESKKNADVGEIGLFEEVLDKLKVKNGNKVKIKVEKKPISIDHIKKRLNGVELNKKEINEIISDMMENKLTEVELTYFVASCYSKKLSTKETTYLTQSIKDHGNSINFKGNKILDKHAIGGIPGNRTSMIVVPIVAAAGFTIPKTSSRAISSASGTADTMEVLANICISCKQIKKIVNKFKGCLVWGGGIDLASADDKLIRIRHPLGLDPEGMMMASILAKKMAVHSKYVLIDISVGENAKVKTKKEANRLKEKFERLGRSLGMKVKVVLSDGKEPIGNGIGPSLEARDVLYLLRRDCKRPLDLEKKSLRLATELLKMGGVKNAGLKVKRILDSELAYEKMKQIIKAQGGNPLILPDEIRIGKFHYDVKSWRSGKIKKINPYLMNKVARIAGAPLDKEAGAYLYVHVGNKVKKNDKLFTLYSDNKDRLKFAKSFNVKEIFKIS